MWFMDLMIDAIYHGALWASIINYLIFPCFLLWSCFDNLCIKRYRNKGDLTIVKRCQDDQSIFGVCVNISYCLRCLNKRIKFSSLEKWQTSRQLPRLNLKDKSDLCAIWTKPLPFPAFPMDLCMCTDQRSGEPFDKLGNFAACWRALAEGLRFSATPEEGGDIPSLLVGTNHI